MQTTIRADGWTKEIQAFAGMKGRYMTNQVRIMHHCRNSELVLPYIHVYIAVDYTSDAKLDRFPQI